MRIAKICTFDNKSLKNICTFAVCIFAQLPVCTLSYNLDKKLYPKPINSKVWILNKFRTLFVLFQNRA
jgi:hypothetical protein